MKRNDCPRRRDASRGGMVLLLALAALASEGSAATVGYWRFETDTDGTGALSTPNSVAGNPLTATAANIDSQVPVGVIPQTGASNGFSVNGSADINGQVATYAALNTGSITVEFWARTLEGTATFVSRYSAGDSGFQILNPNNVRVDYVLNNGGAAQAVGFDSGMNFDAPWQHFAWTYDSVSGLSRVYADGVQVFVTPGGSATPGLSLRWNATPNLLVGSGMDGGTISSGNGSGYFDELRISDVALTPAQFLNATPVPEPASVMFLGIVGLGLLGWRRCRPQTA